MRLSAGVDGATTTPRESAQLQALVPGPWAGYASRLMSKPIQRDFTLEPEDNERLAKLCGPFDEHLRLVELRLGVQIANRGFVFRVTGDADAVRPAERVLRMLYEQAEHTALEPRDVHLALQESGAVRQLQEDAGHAAAAAQEVTIKTRRGSIRGRGANQFLVTAKSSE